MYHHQEKKMAISYPWAMNKKTKGTLFSQTLKVEEKKVLLFLSFEVNLVRYGDFDFLQIFPFLGREG